MRQLYKFDIDKIVDHIKKYKSHIGILYDRFIYTDNLKALGLFSTEEIKSLTEKRPFEKEVILKKRLSNGLLGSISNDKNKFFKISHWIQNNIDLNKSSLDEVLLLNENLINNEQSDFENIEQFSKVLSILHPQLYVEYNSRIVYTINCILLDEQAGNHFFPIPPCNDFQLLKFRMNINILQCDENYDPDEEYSLKDKFIQKKIAYNEYNILLNNIASRLWGENKIDKLLQTQILLFSISDKNIFCDPPILINS